MSSSVEYNDAVKSLPEYANDEDVYARRWVAGVKETPPDVLDKLSNDEDWLVRMAVASNISASRETLKKIWNNEDESDSIRRKAIITMDNQIAYRMNLEEELSEKNNEQVKTDEIDLDKLDIEELREMARDETTSPEILRNLISYNDKDLNYLVAENESAPEDVLVELAGDKEWVVRCAVALNRAAPAEILKNLSKDRHGHVRSAVAINTSSPEDVLDSLSMDKNVSVREAVTRNEAVTADILTKMSDDDNDIVRRNIAHNKTVVTAEVLRKLADDEDWYIRREVAENQRAPADVLVKLSKDEQEGIRADVGNNPNAPPEIIKEISKSADWKTRRMVAMNRAAPAEVLNRLAGDENYWVQFAVANNDSASHETLMRLAESKDEKLSLEAKETLKRIDKTSEISEEYQISEEASPETPLETHESPVEYNKPVAGQSENEFCEPRKTEENNAPGLKGASAHIAGIKEMFIDLLEKDNLPFNKKNYYVDVAETPYDAEKAEYFEKSNAVAAVLHMASIGSKDPRYYRKETIERGAEPTADSMLSEDAMPLKVLYRETNKDGEYENKTQIFYNGAQIKKIEPYKDMFPPPCPTEVIKAEECATPEAQLKENITKWQVAVWEGKGFIPSKTTFANNDFITVIKGMTDNQLSSLCYVCDKEANRILEQSQQKPELQNQNKIEVGRKL